MNGPQRRLLAIGLVIGATPALILALGFSYSAAVLGTILVVALSWVPVLLAFEARARLRDPGTFLPGVDDAGT